MYVCTDYKRAAPILIRRSPLPPSSSSVAQVATCSGSVSAEHGIGLLKQKAFLKHKNPPVIEAMKKVKQLFDPNNIMNPGKVLL